MGAPLQSDSITETLSVSDEIGEIIEQFVKKGSTVPASLLHSHVFRKQWFVATFLPKLLAWKGENTEARNNLIVALKKMNKIPDDMYKTFIQEQKKKAK